MNRSSRGWRVCAALALALTLSQGVEALCPHGPAGPPPRRGGGNGSGGSGGAPPRENPLPPGPAAPGPATPAAPGPNTPGPNAPGPRSPGPNTGGPAGPFVSGPTTPRRPTPPCAGPRGVPLVFTRRDTSKDRLRLRWDYPVPELGEQVLSYEQSLDRIRGDDPRPMIVLRECTECVGSDAALLNSKLDNERTAILTRWFHCVKLPTHVSEATHPFNLLFDAGEHLFLVSADRTQRVALSGRQPQSTLWKAMHTMLRRDYQKRAESSVRGLLRLLDEFDSLDEQEDTLRQQLDAAMVASGPTAARTKKLVAKLNELRADKKQTLERERELVDLGLKAKSDEE